MSQKDYKDEPRDVETEVPADQPGEQEVEVKAEPLGKTVVSTMSADLKDMVEQYEKALAACEHEKVVKHVSKHLEAMKAMCQKLDELHEAEYGQGEKSEEPEDDKPAEEAKDEEPAEEKAEESDDKKDDEGEKNWKAVAMKAFAKALEAVTRNEVREVEEKLTPQEEREIAALERAIQRRLDLVSRLA